MFRYIQLLVLLFLEFVNVQAQTTPIHLFENYEKGVVYLKNHTQSHSTLNYDAANQKLSFIEKGEVLEINDISLIDSVYIGTRKFLPHKKHFVECVSLSHGNLLIDWKLKEKYTGKKVGAMGLANGGAIQKVNIGLLYAKSQSDERSTEIYKSENENIYHLNIQNKHIEFRNQKQLLKGVTEAMAEKIKAFIKENNTNFYDVEDVISLSRFILENSRSYKKSI